MRMKRFLSFMLALVMLASMAISASAATLKFAIDFDKYSTIDAFLENAAENTSRNTAGAIALRDAGTYVSYGASNDSGDWIGTKNQVTYSSFTTDAAGLKWFQFLPYEDEADAQNNRNGNFWAMPAAANAWNYTTNPNETYIISFDLKVTPPVLATEITAEKNNDMNTMWASDTAGTNEKNDFTFRLQRSATAQEVKLITFKSGAASNGYGYETVLTNGATYKLALANKLGYESNGTAKTYPHRIFAINGVNVQESTGKSQAENTQPLLYGFKWKHDYHIGESFRNFKMYTVDNSAGGFNVSSTVTGEVPVTTVSVPVKFSHPVYASTFNPANVTVSRTDIDGTYPLAYGDDFTVTGITEVATGNEIYSTATVNFNAYLEDSSEYTITFPTAITNELGTAIEAEYASVSFTTPSPEVIVGNKVITKAWGTDAAATVEEFAADGVYGVSLDVENTTDAVKNIAAIYAVYAGGKLADVVYVNESIAGEKTATIGVGVNLPEATAGGQVKAFIWDGITSIKPLTESTVWDIAE